MAKIRVSATVEKDVLKSIDRILKEGDYRNRSHFIERASEKLIEEEGDAKKK